MNQIQLNSNQPLALRVQGLEKTYGGGLTSQTRALDGISFDVPQGQYVAIMGPSGSGKTTLLNCIATIDKPTAGQIYVGPDNLNALPTRALADFRRERIGFIFQDANLLDTITVRENIALPLTIGKMKAVEILRRVEEIALTLNVDDILDKYPYQISGGQKQRVAAARAFVTRPHIMLADEPTGSLDSKNAKILLEYLAHLNSDLGTSILMVTHDSYAASFTERVLFIRDGRIFTELVRGTSSRTDFFDAIVNVISSIGGV
ncbi:MAG: ABC transporter ATP-binding protein [Actinomycetaceae bacterium]|nr:ABC transporter ATP-binding protein [Actinomycetaceae bacterium]